MPQKQQFASALLSGFGFGVERESRDAENVMRCAK